MELRIEDVSMHFKDKVALDHLSVTLNEGVYGFLGPNGAGKTTLMKIIVNILQPTSGKVYYNNQDIRDLKEKYREIIGFQPQNVGFYSNFTAYEFLEYMYYLKGLPKGELKGTIEILLIKTNLVEDKDRKIGGFSGGMKQRLGIAQALLNDPKILILDEPTAGLDPKERIRFRNIISQLSKDKIIILATHIVGDLENIAHSLLLIKEGKLINNSSKEELIESIEGYVWEVETDKEITEEFVISNVINNRYRVISETKPMENAVCVTANLEDVFLYFFER